MTASQLTKQIIEYCTAQGYFVFRVNNIPGRKYRANTLMKGIPDILGINKLGTALAIEVKTTDLQSEHQKRFEKNFLKHKGIYILAYKLEDVSNRV